MFERFSKRTYASRFFAPDTIFTKAREHLFPRFFEQRGMDPEIAVTVLDELLVLLGCMDAEIYWPFETAARWY